MARFKFKALGSANAQVEGVIIAGSRREALQRLIESGQHPLDLHEQPESAGGASLSWRLGLRPIRLSTLSRQLATLAASGAPVLKGLTVITEQTRDAQAKQTLLNVIEDVHGGSTLADALEKHPVTFPRLMTSMIRVGEMGGNLDEQLLQLAEVYEKEETLKGELKAALAYPMLVLGLGILSALILVAFFVPRLETLFEGSGEQLPAATRFLLGLSHFMTGNALLLALLSVALVFGARRALQVPEVRLRLDQAKLRIPWMGPLLRNHEIARFSRLLGALTKAGISIVEALTIVQPVIQNASVAATVQDMIRRIGTGERFANVMKQTGIFPPLAIQMVATGEESGHLDQMLLLLSEAFDRESAAASKVMMSLLAPMLILFVAAIVGFILVSMILPIFQLSTVMR